MHQQAQLEAANQAVKEAQEEKERLALEVTQA